VILALHCCFVICRCGTKLLLLCLVNQKSVTPAFDRVTGEGLAFGGLTVPSNFWFDESAVIWLPRSSLLFGPLGLLLFTAISLADGTSTFFVTSIFTAPISSARISGHLPHPVFAFSLHLLSVFCCYFCYVRYFLVYGSHQVHCSP
jgi:hypothetical protein